MQSNRADDNLSRIAKSFVAARKSAGALPDYPGTIPEGIDQAYAVQDQAITLFGEEIAGWKVGKIVPPEGGVDRLAGPIFASQVVAAAPEPVAMPIFAGGFGAAEAEFVLRIGPNFDPAKASYTMAEAIDALDAVHVGIEIASSPFVGINENGPLVTISDFGNNNGLVIGPSIADWQDAGIAGWPVELLVNGDRIGHATAETMLDGPFGAARFLFELLAARSIPLRPGQWISSGAVTGVHQVKVGDRVEARFDGRLVTCCSIKSA